MCFFNKCGSWHHLLSAEHFKPYTLCYHITLHIRIYVIGNNPTMYYDIHYYSKTNVRADNATLHINTQLM